MKGHTLIELVTVIILVGIVSGLFAVLINQVIETYAFVVVREDILSETDLAVERMTREIRHIKDSLNIYRADATEFQFADTDDNIIDFRQDGTSIFRAEGIAGTNGDLLAEDVSGLTFRYWDENNAELSAIPLSAADRQLIKRIEISTQMQRQNQDVRVDTQVYPRNLPKKTRP